MGGEPRNRARSAMQPEMKKTLWAATVNSREGRLGMEVYISHANSKSMFKQLLAQKDDIESELKVELDWQELPDGHACRILQVRSESPLENEAQWP